MIALIEASVRSSVADYVLALVTVYWIIIIAWILIQWLELLRVRIPLGARPVIAFIRDAAEPYLRLFRRFIPPIGGFDLSPIIAIVLLRIVGVAIANAIRG